MELKIFLMTLVVLCRRKRQFLVENEFKTNFNVFSVCSYY